jgi:hypothetical protein
MAPSKKGVTFDVGTESTGKKRERMAKRPKVESMNPRTARPLLLGEAFMAVMDVFCVKRNELGFFDYVGEFAIGQTNKNIRRALKDDMQRSEMRITNRVTEHFNKACVDLLHWSLPWQGLDDVHTSMDDADPEICEMYKHTLLLHKLKGSTSEVVSHPHESFIRRLLKFGVSKKEIHYQFRSEDGGWQLMEDNMTHILRRYWSARDEVRITSELAAASVAADGAANA